MGNIIYVLPKYFTSSSDSSLPTREKAVESFSHSKSAPTSNSSLGSSIPMQLGLELLTKPGEEKNGKLIVPQVVKINVPTLFPVYSRDKPDIVVPKEAVEKCEDYTRITFHGPKVSETIHMFGGHKINYHPHNEFVFPHNSINHNGDIIGTPYPVSIFCHGSTSASPPSSPAATSFVNRQVPSDGFLEWCFNRQVPSDGFLEWCYTCETEFDEHDEIYIYKGEFSFCSPECRYDKMMVDKMNIAILKKKRKEMEMKKMEMEEKEAKENAKKTIFFIGTNY